MRQSLPQAFKVAFEGILRFLTRERNGKIQLIAAVLAVIAGFIFRISVTEWMFIVSTIAIVLAAEMLNTAIEKTCDLISPGENGHVKFIKDVSAGGVLILSIASAIIGGIIFLPKIF